MDLWHFVMVKPQHYTPVICQNKPAWNQGLPGPDHVITHPDAGWSQFESARESSPGCCTKWTKLCMKTSISKKTGPGSAKPLTVCPFMKTPNSGQLRAVPEIILRGGWAAGTFFVLWVEGVLLTMCPRGAGGGNLSWGSRCIWSIVGRVN